MSKKQNDLSALGEKIAHKSTKSSVHRRFDNADEVLLNNVDQEVRERVIRKSYAITKQDLTGIQFIKDKCLNQRVVLSDSHIIRLAITLAANLSEDALVKASKQIPKIQAGRPRSEIKNS